jgi:hypothetical protein
MGHIRRGALPVLNPFVEVALETGLIKR